MHSAKEIDALLPQTQCGECGFAGCLPYAQALAQGLTTIDRCPPGGVTTMQALGQLLDIEVAPFLEKAKAQTRSPALAVIREADCIGCTKCIQACPVDAIIGTAKQMHSILSHECTGCGLCVTPCPVDCIEMVSQAEATYDKATARARHHAKQVRQLRDQQALEQVYRQKRELVAAVQTEDKKAKQAYIQQVLLKKQRKLTNE